MIPSRSYELQECVPFVSTACKVGYPKKIRPAHPYCFRFEGTRGTFAGTKYIFAADVDAVRAMRRFPLEFLLLFCPCGLQHITT